MPLRSGKITHQIKLKINANICEFYINIILSHRVSKNESKEKLDIIGGLFSQRASQNNTRNWVLISKKINQKFMTQNRTPKQCRERFINHAITSPAQPFSNAWSIQQIEKLFKLFEFYGPRWTSISHELKNKSQNIAKNKFYCSLRKFVRKLNRLLKSGRNKYKKQIRYESIIRILDAYQTFSQMPQHFKKQSYEIRQNILKSTLVTIMEKQLQDEELLKLAQSINKFNLQTRSYKSKRVRSAQALPLQNLRLQQQQSENIPTKQHQCLMNNKNQQQYSNNAQCMKNENSILSLDNQIKVAQEQNSKTQSNKRYSQITQQQLIQDFGHTSSLRSNKSCSEANIFLQMFPEQFLQDYLDKFLCE